MTERITFRPSDEISGVLAIAAHERCNGNVSRFINEALKSHLDQEGLLAHQESEEEQAMAEAKATLLLIGAPKLSALMRETRIAFRRNGRGIRS